MARTVRFQLRRDTAANWASINPTLGPGEPALETDTLKVKYGDGATAWNDLDYATGVVLAIALEAIGALTPAADRFPYFTSGTVAALGTITAFGRSLVDDADAGAARGTLGLGDMATQAASAIAITGGAISGLTNLSITSSGVAVSYARHSASAADAATVALYRARGTVGSPSTVQSGDSLGGVFCSGYGASFSGFIGNILFRATETYSGTGRGTECVIQTTANGSSTAGSRTLISDLGLQQVGYVRPSASNTYSCGTASNLWSTVYAATGAINTSDQRYKRWRGALDAAEVRAGMRIIGELGFYQWKDAVKAKGKDGARWHYGVRAQRAFAILESEGLDWRRYAWCCHDAWDASPAVRGPNRELIIPARRAGHRYGIRPDQLALFLIGAQEAAHRAEMNSMREQMQTMLARLGALEAAA